MSYLLEILGRGLLVELRAAFRDLLANGTDLDLPHARSLAEKFPNDHDSQCTYALALLECGELQRARSMFERAMAIDPTHRRARIGLACTLDTLGFTEDAIEHLHECLPGDPKANGSSEIAAVLFAIAYCQERMGDASGAVIGYERALDVAPGLRNARERIAAIHLQMGDVRRAAECYEHICAMEPGDLNAIMTLASLYLQRGNYDGAARQYEIAITLDPDNWTTTDQFVEMCVEAGRLDDAIEELRRRIAQRPDAADQHLRLGDLYHKAGRPNDAERAYQCALDVNPEYLEATVKSGTARLRRGDRHGASASFARAIEINDRITTAYVGLGVAHGALGELQQAAECFDMAGGIEGNSALLFSEIARMELQATAGAQTKKYLDPADIARNPAGPAHETVSTLIDRQIANLRRTLSDRPGHADLHYRLGVLLESKCDFEAALKAYQDATQINPQYLKAQTKRALTLHRLGRFAEATEVAKRAFEIDPESVELHYRLGLLFADQSRFDRALDHFETAASKEPNNIEYIAHLALALQHMGLLDRATETVNAIRNLSSAAPETMKLTADETTDF